MDQQLVWRKGLFDSDYQIYDNGQIYATLLFSTWKNNARGIAQQRNYYFTTYGFINPITKIYDEKHEEIGVINYHSWQLKATVTFKDRSHASWGYSNGWLSNWNITDHENRQIQFHSSTATGTIFCKDGDEILLLCGLYIREYFSRIMIFILIIVLFPVLFRSI